MYQHYDFLRDRMRPAPKRVDPAPARPPAPAPAPLPARPLAPRPPSAPAPAPRMPLPPPPVRSAPAPFVPVPPVPGPPVAPAPAVVPDPPVDAQDAGRGWRRLVRAASFGLVAPGPSAAEREATDLEAAVQIPLAGNYKVGVLGKGGVGKTAVAVGVGSILAELRDADEVVAVDADTAFGRLSSRIDPRPTGSFRELTSGRNADSFADITTHLGRNDVGLYVLGGESAQGPGQGPRTVLDPAIYREAALRLDRHFAIAVIDCGSTLDSGVTQEVLRDLDALIVVSSPWADGAAAAAKTMEWLTDRGLTDLLARSVVVLNDSDGHSDKRTRSVLAREFAEHGRQVVEVPFDPHLRPGGVIDVRDGRDGVDPATRHKFLQIAATVTRYFAARPAAGRAADS